MYCPARASSDVASSLAPSPGRRPAPEGVWSGRRGVLRLQSARCSIRPVVPGKVLRLPAEAAAVPIPNSPGGPQSSRRKSAGGGGCGDDRASLCQRCRPSDGVGSGRRVYPSRPVVRPDSSTSSIRRSCRNSPGWACGRRCRPALRRAAPPRLRPMAQSPIGACVAGDAEQSVRSETDHS